MTIWVFLQFVLVFFLFLFLRNEVAHRLSKEAIVRTAALTLAGVETERDRWRWFRLYDTVSYDSLVLRFWIWRVEQAYPWLENPKEVAGPAARDRGL